jgi:hypothetical protein
LRTPIRSTQVPLLVCPPPPLPPKCGLLTLTNETTIPRKDSKRGVIVWPVQAKPFCGSVPGNRSKEACLEAAHLSISHPKSRKSKDCDGWGGQCSSASAVVPIGGKKKRPRPARALGRQIGRWENEGGRDPLKRFSFFGRVYFFFLGQVQVRFQGLWGVDFLRRGVDGYVTLAMSQSECRVESPTTAVRLDQPFSAQVHFCRVTGFPHKHTKMPLCKVRTPS